MAPTPKKQNIVGGEKQKTIKAECDLTYKPHPKTVGKSRRGKRALTDGDGRRSDWAVGTQRMCGPGDTGTHT